MKFDVPAARRALSLPQVTDSARMALVVGSILNVINQGDALLALSHVDWAKLLLTYCVPFAVATYSAYRVYRAMHLTK